MTGRRTITNTSDPAQPRHTSSVEMSMEFRKFARSPLETALVMSSRNTSPHTVELGHRTATEVQQASKLISFTCSKSISLKMLFSRSTSQLVACVLHAQYSIENKSHPRTTDSGWHVLETRSKVHMEIQETAWNHDVSTWNCACSARVWICFRIRTSRSAPALSIAVLQNTPVTTSLCSSLTAALRLNAYGQNIP